MSNRQERDKNEAAARDKSDGWMSEFAFALPMGLAAAVMWIGSLVGMHYIEWGTFF